MVVKARNLNEQPCWCSIVGNKACLLRCMPGVDEFLHIWGMHVGVDGQCKALGGGSLN